MSEKITYVKLDTTDRKGDLLMSKAGRPYTRQTLKVSSKGDKYISGFMNESTKGWAVGNDVDILITESTTLDKNNQPYLNWSLPKKEDKVGEKLEEILNKITAGNLRLSMIEEHLKMTKTVDKPHYPSAEEEGIDVDQTFPDDVDTSSVPF